MGCCKSKHGQLSVVDYCCEQDTNEAVVALVDPVVDESTALLEWREYESGLPQVTEEEALSSPPVGNLALMDFAQRMAEEIMAMAMQQWKELDRRFGDIPYIDTD
ncbi:small membrane A-kinase anchor protein-like [Engraulis encrasicolus]|uniref:small membrane A-kinase anchor protein-like n=1 Tax=Engraulis encrasicolus TaxID=184585 RepID=UPI002FD1535D